MAIIDRTDTLALVSTDWHGVTFYHVAERSLGTTIAGGYLDPEDAREAFTLLAEVGDGDPDPDLPTWDLQLTDSGDVSNGDAAGWVGFSQDWENNSEEFWDAVRDHSHGLPDWFEEELQRGRMLWLPPDAARDLLERLERVPGWADPDAPEYARHPLTIHEPGDVDWRTLPEEPRQEVAL